MDHLIEIAFKGNRKEFFLWEGDAPPPLQAAVIVDADRGEDLGRVHSTGELALKRAAGVPHKPGEEGAQRRARRLATGEDVQRHDELRSQDEIARRRAMERVKANNLLMKLSDAEWQWDRRKLTIYFTAEKRVDFRDLVKDLAAMFRTRIELRQIGVRDEAGRIGGVGTCGRELCCATWLREFEPITLKMAKDQGLSPSPSKISGACGRLKCCLRYELDFYKESNREFPKQGSRLTLPDGEFDVTRVDIFHRTLLLRDEGGKETTVLLSDVPKGTRIVGPSRDRRKGCDKNECASRGTKPGDGENPPAAGGGGQGGPHGPGPHGGHGGQGSRGGRDARQGGRPPQRRPDAPPGGRG